MRGWLAYLARADTIERQVEAYRRLRAHIARFQKIPMLDFDRSAAAEFDRLRRLRIRIGTMDMKIASIAIVNNLTLLTRNMSDFGKVPGLRAEDWTM